MCIGYKIGVQAWQREKLLQHVGVALGCFRYPYRFTSEPVMHLAPGVGYWLGTLEDSWIGDQAQEGQQARPREPYAR